MIQLPFVEAEAQNLSSDVNIRADFVGRFSAC